MDSARDADEIIVVGEGCDPQVVSHHKTVVTRVERGGGERLKAGHAARARGMELASGSHVAFLADDRAYVPGAFDLVREISSHSFTRRR